MYFAAAKNALYARQGRASANDMAAQTRALFQADTNLMFYYNHTFADGRWSHFMDQTHIGYTNWRDPEFNNMDAIKLTEIKVPDAATLGVAVEGSENAWSNTNSEEAILPKFDSFNRQRHYVEVFNKGKTSFEFTAIADKPWITLSDSQGRVDKDKRLWVGVNWSKAPKGNARGTVKITGAGREVVVKINAFNPTEVTRDSLRGFVEGAGVVSIEPEHFTKKTDIGENRWIRIEDYGRTWSGMRATQPVDAPALHREKIRRALNIKRISSTRARWKL